MGIYAVFLNNGQQLVSEIENADMPSQVRLKRPMVCHPIQNANGSMQMSFYPFGFPLLTPPVDGKPYLTFDVQKSNILTMVDITADVVQKQLVDNYKQATSKIIQSAGISMR